MTFDLERKDTICALATPDAPAALAIVRVSGARADEIRGRVFRPHAKGAQQERVATLGDVVDAAGAVVDEALCTSFGEGRSYTGEASFELSLHGSPLRVRATLRALVEAGCRLAEPGELTLRAVLTGRMDLVEAEAVDDVIHAKTDAAARAALRALRGGLARKIDPVREAIVDALTEIEARLDFPDEDLGEARVTELQQSLQQAQSVTAQLLSSAQFGRRLHDGARVVLYGPPNAGKSTLLNALLGEERALVHHEPGTTRDVIEASTVLGGIAVTLVDVAGVRPLGDAGAVERMGIARAEAERERADVVVTLVPADEPNAPALDGDIDVISKIDLARPASMNINALAVSAKTGAGLDSLRARLVELLRQGAPDDEEALLMRERQVEHVAAADTALSASLAALAERAPGEVVASELRRASSALDRLLGKDTNADVIERVFSRFCIGK